MTEDTLEVVRVGGVVRCIYLNDFRIAGSKPYASENPVYTTFKVPVGEIRQHLKRKSRKQEANHGE